MNGTAGRSRAGARRRRAGAAVAAALAVAALAALVPAAEAGLPDHPAIVHAPPPAWVAPAGPLRPAPAEASAIALRQLDEQVLADGDASAVFSRRVVEVLSQQGLEEAAQWEVGFDPDSQKLAVHGLEVFRDGVWSDRLATSRASVLQREPELDRRLYDESLTLLMVVEDVRVGDLVRIAHTVEGFNPVLGDRYAGGFALGWSVPVAEHRLRVVAPAGRPLFYRLHGAGAPRPERTVGDGRVALTWHRLEVAAVEPEHDPPAGWVSFPFVQLSQFRTWAEVAEWGRALYPPQPPPPEVTEVAIEIAGASPGDSGAQLVAATRWVQDRVRYFAIALGPHSHAPYDLDEIVRRRYGDCKDKARLLIGLLGALGIEAWPALVDVDFGARLADFHPSPFAFDHVVVVARPDGPRGRRVWIDATLELQGGGAGDLWFPPYGAALELRPGVEALTAVPAEPSRPGVTAVRYDYRLGEAGEPFEVDIATTYRRDGADRMRRTLAGTGAGELLERYVEFYTDGERTVEPRAPLEVADDREADELAVTERYRVVGCWQRAESMLNCDLLPLTLLADLVEPASSERSSPLRLPRDLHTRETVSIEAATPWDFEPVEESEENPWFEFTVASTPGERSIELVYELETRARMVEPEGVARYARALRSTLGATGYSLQSDQPLERSPAKAEDPLEPLYVAIGCAVLAAFPLALLTAVVVLLVIVRRRNRRLREETPMGTQTPPRLAATCPRCGAATSPGTRFCAACGSALDSTTTAAKAGKGGAGPIVAVLAAVGCGVVAIAFIGIIAAILIPNFIDALGKAKQKRTVADMRLIATGLESYRATEGSYPDVATAGELAAVLEEAGLLTETPTADGWKHPLGYTCWQSDPSADGCDDYRLGSPAADGEFEHPDLGDYPPATTERSDFTRDIVYGPEGVVQAPGEP